MTEIVSGSTKVYFKHIIRRRDRYAWEEQSKEANKRIDWLKTTHNINEYLNVELQSLLTCKLIAVWRSRGNYRKGRWICKGITKEAIIHCVWVGFPPNNGYSLLFRRIFIWVSVSESSLDQMFRNWLISSSRGWNSTYRRKKKITDDTVFIDSALPCS